LSHTLGLTTVAEGVETAETAVALQRFGCDVVQGHYFSPPLTTADVLHLLSNPAGIAQRPDAATVAALHTPPTRGPAR
jgi:EAL domain-containing protein (putative c-di-GMP-specific phosphodiesterase class I)